MKKLQTPIKVLPEKAILIKKGIPHWLWLECLYKGKLLDMTAGDVVREALMLWKNKRD